MSENLKRSNPDFSKYDSMSIGKLEEILRADALGPERDGSDVDEILYVMEVLAKKRRQNGIAGKTAHEAYQEFQQHYLPMVEEESQPRHKSNVIPFRRIAAVAACLVLVFSLTTTANAFSFRDVWGAVVTWAQETFCFSTGAEVSEPKTEDDISYSSFNEILNNNGRDGTLVPTYIPANYILTDIVIDRTPKQETFLAIYTNQENVIRITIQSFLSNHPEQVERSNDLVEILTSSTIDYYIFSNNKQNCVAWISDSYECTICGDVSLDELKLMIASIQKG